MNVDCRDLYLFTLRVRLADCLSGCCILLEYLEFTVHIMKPLRNRPPLLLR